MSINADSTGTCDNCGTVYPNAGIMYFIIVSDLVPNNPGVIEQLLFCRANKCDKKIRRKILLAHYKVPPAAVIPEPADDGASTDPAPTDPAPTT